MIIKSEKYKNKRLHLAKKIVIYLQITNYKSVKGLKYLRVRKYLVKQYDATDCVAGTGLIVALSYGQIWLVAKIMKITFGVAVRTLKIAGVASIVAASTGISATVVIAVLSKVF